jgi:hypothetical protein
MSLRYTTLRHIECPLGTTDNENQGNSEGSSYEIQ